MLTRLVKLTLEEDKVNQFLQIFEERRALIAETEGCLNVTLLQDIHHPHIVFTHSQWLDEQALNRYRDSALFIDTWKLVKPLFKSPAQAWSVVSK